jgi:Fe-S cluster assembly protein SufD
MNKQSTNFYTADFQTQAVHLPGFDQAWLVKIRADSASAFSEYGFPSPRAEEWRYTNISALEKKRFSPCTEKSHAKIDSAWLHSAQLSDAWSLVFIDGHFSAELSLLEQLPSSVSIMSMADALSTCPERVLAHFSQAVNFREHGFIAFNDAWFTDGLFMHIPVKLKLEKPVQLLHIMTRADAIATTRNLIILDEMAEAQLIETFIGLDNAYLTATVNELFIESNAKLSWYKVQSESDKAYHFGGSYIKQGADATFTHHNFAFGGLMARSDIHCDLDRGSACELNGLYLGSKRQHIDNHTRINHLKPHASSRELYKGVLDDRARGVFQGRVVVAENAQNTDSQMNNRNLLLSNEAEADTKPQLEIYADDVKCGHGVTVGQLDEQSIFYLQSRCIDEISARNMLTFAFANEMINKIKLKNLHDKVLELLLARFPQEGIEKNWL